MAEQTRLTDAELEAMRGHTPGPWDVDTVRNEGDYGDGGPNCRSGFDSFAVVDERGYVLFDTLNSDHRISSVREESYEAGIHAWDEQGQKNIRIAAAATSLLAEVIERRARDAAVAELVEAAADLIDMLRHKDETHNERNDRVAAKFLRDTGIPAPSNERSPLHSDRERWDAYEAWSAAKRDRLNAAIAAVRGGARPC